MSQQMGSTFFLGAIGTTGAICSILTFLTSSRFWPFIKRRRYEKQWHIDHNELANEHTNLLIAAGNTESQKAKNLIADSELRIQRSKLYSPNMTQQETAIEQLVEIGGKQAFDILARRLGREPALSDATRDSIINSLAKLAQL